MFVCIHFAWSLALSQGTPIMIGGGSLAYGLLGVAIQTDTNPQSAVGGQAHVKFLILDPHYKGKDEVKAVLAKGFCAWKDPKALFKPDIFYNFLLPQRTRYV